MSTALAPAMLKLAALCTIAMTSMTSMLSMADAAPAPSEAEALAQAAQLAHDYRERCDPGERAFLDHALAATRNPRVLDDTALMLAAEGANPGIYVPLAAAAVRLQPKAAINWNNLGAVLRRIEPKSSLPPLRRAVAIDPQAAIALDNLGNSLLDTSDATALQVLQAAAAADPDLGAVHEALAEIDLRRVDSVGAYREVVAAILAGDSGPNLERLRVGTENAHFPLDGPPAVVPTEITFATDRGPVTLTSARDTATTLVLPGELPTWHSWRELTADKRAPYAELANALTQSNLGMLAALRPHGHQPRPLSSSARLRLELLTNYYKHVFSARQFKLAGATQALIKQFGDDTEATFRDGHICDHSNAYQAAADRYLVAAFNLVTDSWRDERADMLRYWAASEQLVGGVFDDVTYQQISDLRRITLRGWTAASFGLFASPLGLDFLPMDGCPAQGETPKAELEALTTAAPGDPLPLPAESKAPCPSWLQLSLKVMGITVKASCEKAELSVTKGIAAGLKYTYETTELKIYAGLGDSEGITVGGAERSVEAKIVGEATFKDGQLVSITGNVEASAALTVDGLEAKGKASASIGLWGEVPPTSYGVTGTVTGKAKL